MSKRVFLQATAAALAGALLPACGGGGGRDDGVPIGSDTLLQLLQQDGNSSTMLAAAGRAGLSATLGDASQNLTLFAADNDAFGRMASRLGLGSSNDLIDALTPSQWQGILRFNLLAQRRSRGSLTPGTRTDTLYEFRGDAAELIFVSENGRFSLWDGVGRTSITLPRADIGASNGVLHVASDLLLPRGVLTVGQMLRLSIDSFSAFAESMVSTGVASTFDGTGPFTVFTPTNNAMSRALTGNEVRHHVMTGELDGDDFALQTLTPLFGRQLTLRDGTSAVILATLSYGTSVQANVTDVDFFASNGVIHVIDTVIPL